MNKNIFKSIGTILAGMVMGTVLSINADFVLEMIGIFPSQGQGLFIWWMLLIALVYRGVHTVAAGYVTAALAPNQPMHYAIILGIIGVVVTVLGTIANWEQSSAWYDCAYTDYSALHVAGWKIS